jgi:hypothetical protein
VYASLRAAGKKADLSLIVADEPAVAGGCFTKNVMCAAPVLYCKDVLERKQKVKAVRPTQKASMGVVLCEVIGCVIALGCTARTCWPSNRKSRRYVALEKQEQVWCLRSESVSHTV